jgi:predicted RNA-binding protein YlxR (DUF448 family)
MKETLRMCVACRGMKPKSALVKVTKNKQGQFTAGDTYDGRGANVCQTNEYIKKCRDKKGFNRAFKGEVPPEIYAKAEELIGNVEERN